MNDYFLHFYNLFIYLKPSYSFILAFFIVKLKEIMKMSNNPKQSNFQSIQQTIDFYRPSFKSSNHEYMISNPVSKRKFKKSLSQHVHDYKKNKSQNVKSSDPTTVSQQTQFHNSQSSKQNQLLAGLLKTRKSEMKKFKLKQFYLSYFVQKGQVQNEQQSGNVSQDKLQNNRQLIKTLQPKPFQQKNNNNCIFNRRKVLPVRLRAKSYINIPKNKYKQSKRQLSSQNDLIAKSSQHLLDKNYQTFLGFYCHKKQINNIRHRKPGCKNLRDITNIDPNNQKVLQEIPAKINKILMNDNMENETKVVTQRIWRKQKTQKNAAFLKKDYNFQLNPWIEPHNEEDKQNELSFYF